MVATVDNHQPYMAFLSKLTQLLSDYSIEEISALWHQAQVDDSKAADVMAVTPKPAGGAQSQAEAIGIAGGGGHDPGVRRRSVSGFS
ncbi:MAG: hypothetical protein ETSY1_25735 [Candidatus Entotheonella factor]|uniref:Uncharacterized protein n=1 Tax=Entotheonella factor TaxID=1429438 RepID=W4LFF2_ENTF1|nr:MAG: hypothetical protein ETSY1_25735 [Candidatus Entotheonella factor]